MHLPGLTSLQQVHNSTLEAFTQAALILALAVAIVAANVILIAAIVNYRGEHKRTKSRPIYSVSLYIRIFFSFFSSVGPSEVINHYLLSLATADLLCGLLIVPLSVYPALTGEWLYGNIACRLVGYLEVTLWSVSVYTFMWISVDRYLAVRKPLRYETVQTKTR